MFNGQINNQNINEKIDKEYYVDKINAIRNIADNSSEVVNMLTSVGMETSINNILASSDFFLTTVI